MFKRFITFIFALLLCITPTFASTLNTNDPITYQIPSNIDQSWYPLRASSEHLPITVWWDSQSQSVAIRRDGTSRETLMLSRDYIFKNPEIAIQNGVTYCSPRFLTALLDGRGFVYNGEVYYPDINQDIKIQGPEIFKQRVSAALYLLKLKMPEMYDMVLHNLTGGIAYVSPFDDFAPTSAVGFVYSHSKNPTCYIVGNYSGATLASYIVHEAYHVEQVKTLGCTNEEDTEQIEWEVYLELIS